MSAAKHRRVAPQSRLNIAGAPLRQPINEAPSAEFVNKAHRLKHNVSTMYIMAYLGGEEDDTTVASQLEEKALCRITTVDDAVMYISPDFTYGSDKPYRLD